MENPITKLLLFIAFLIFFSSLSNAQSPIEIRFLPKDYVCVYETKGLGTPGEIYTIVIQNIGIINKQLDSFSVAHVELIAIKEGVAIQKVLVSQDHLMESAQKYKAYQDQGIFQLYDFQFQTSKFLNGINLSGSTTLSKGEALLITHRTMLFQALPDSIKIVVKAIDPKGNPITDEKSLAVVNHKSINEYHFPLKGTWIAAGAPSLISHHRWASIQEFAFDFIKIGKSGKTHKGDGSKLSQYYAYGEAVYSIGSGKVVSVSDGAIESNKNLKQADETAEQYLIRSSTQQQELLSKGFENVLGNHIIIQHEGGEYSYYLHLKTKSLRVRVGDTVKRGEHIAQLGHSGNSTEPHLHFHLTDGPDMKYSRSIPISFQNVFLYPDDNGQIRHIHYGQIIMTED